MGWVLGALLSIAGSIASNLGVNIQKYSFIRQTMREPQQRTTHWKDAYWLSGLALVVFGSLGDFAALSMVAQSIVAPLASTTLVTNVIFAHFWLHEKVGRRELIGTSLIIIGSTLAVVFGDHDTRSYTNHALVNLIGGAWFLVYAILVVILCAAGLMLHRRITPIKKNLVDAIRRYEAAAEAGDSQTADYEDEVIARLEQDYKKWVKIHPFSLCALSGAFGAQSVLFGKCFAELISTTLEGSMQLDNIFPWVCVVAMGVTVTIQLHFLAIALNYFDALYAVPVFQCFFIGVSTLGGALYFREVYDFDVGTAFAFVIGLGLTLGGVAVLSTRKMSQRNVVNRVKAQNATAGFSLLPTDTPLSSTAIPEGDEESGDTDGLEDTLAKRKSLTPVTGSPSLTSLHDRKRGQEFEMDDIGARRASTMPILKSSAQLPHFSERAESEQQEMAELAATIDGSAQSLAAKLDAIKQAQLASAAASLSPSASSETSSLLHPSPSALTPAMAIQIEADQDYLNRQDNKSGITGVPVSEAARKHKQALVTRYDADLEILKLNGGIEQLASPSFNRIRAISIDGVPSSNASSSSRAETPRSSYVQERERAASRDSASGRSSPSLGASEVTPRRERGPDSPSMAGDSHPGLARAPSTIEQPGNVPHVTPSAMFSGAFLESAQELPSIESDTRLQRITRLSTVGHWVQGLHAQAPVVGGVVQAILQANEMQLLLDNEMPKTDVKASPSPPSSDKKDETRIDMPVAMPVPTSIELMDIKTAVPDDSEASTAKASSPSPPQVPTLLVPSSSSASSTSVATPVASSPTPAASTTPSSTLTVDSSAAPPTNRVILFDDEYDPFSTQATTKLTHRDPFQPTPDELASPTSAFASLKRTSTILSASPLVAATNESRARDAEERALLTEHAIASASGNLFSPLSEVSRHPLQEGGKPSTPDPIDIVGMAVAAEPEPISDSIVPAVTTPILIPQNAPAFPPTPNSALSPEEDVDEWAAALRIQSLVRGRKIRRSLRASGQLTSAQLALVNQADEDSTSYVAVDPTATTPVAEAEEEAAEEEGSGEEVNLM